MATETKELPQAPIGEHHDREEWLEWRRGHVGASEVAALFGLHPYLTKRELYYKKIGPYEEDEEPGRDIRRGRALEHIAVEEFEKLTGRETRRVPARRHPECEFLGCSLDRQILADDDHPETEGLEAKVPGYHVFEEIKANGLRDYMSIQGIVEALVYGYPRTQFAVLHGDSFELLTFPVEADASFEPAILGECERFFTEHVIPRRPPEPDDEPARIEVPETKGELVTVDDPEFARLAERLLAAKEIRDEARETYKTLKNELQGYLGEEPGKYRAQGAGVQVSLYWSKGRTRFQKKELFAVQPLDPEKVREIAGAHNARWLSEALGNGDLRLDLTEFERHSRPYPSMRISTYDDG